MYDIFNTLYSKRGTTKALLCVFSFHLHIMFEFDHQIFKTCQDASINNGQKQLLSRADERTEPMIWVLIQGSFNIPPALLRAYLFAWMYVLQIDKSFSGRLRE